MARITRYVLIACAAALGVQPQGLLAQAYPAKPIRVVVPFGAGGPADIYARFLGQQMQGVLGQPFVVSVSNHERQAVDLHSVTGP